MQNMILVKGRYKSYWQSKNSRRNDDVREHKVSDNKFGYWLQTPFPAQPEERMLLRWRVALS